MPEFHVHQNPEAHYTVYQILFPDGKRYIGYTGGTLKQRMQNRYRNNPSMHAEIQRIGKTNIRMEPLCEKLTRECAWLLEDKFIELYQTRDPRYGYNCYTGGPQHGARPNKEWICSDRERALARVKDPDCSFAKGTNRPRVPVRCIETGEEFPSIRAAARSVSVYWTSIHQCCHHRLHTCAGCHWEFIAEEEKTA